MNLIELMEDTFIKNKKTLILQQVTNGFLSSLGFYSGLYSHLMLQSSIPFFTSVGLGMLGQYNLYKKKQIF